MKGVEYLKFGTRFEKYSLKTFTNSLLSDTTFSFSINVILSLFNVLSVRHGFSFFQNYPFNIKIVEKIFFLVFRSSLTQIIRCFLYATCDDIVLSCLNLFNNFDLVMTAFPKSLFTNVAWLHFLLMVHVCQIYTEQ